MSARASFMPTAVIAACIAGVVLFAGSASFAQSTGMPSARQEGGAEGDTRGAIRSLGAAGYNERGAEKPPAVDVPPLDEDVSGTSGPPRGTLPARRAR